MNRDFRYYRRDLVVRDGDGRPRIPDLDPLLVALVREHGPDGRPDIAPQTKRQNGRDSMTMRILNAAALWAAIAVVLALTFRAAPGEEKTLYNDKGQEVGRATTRDGTTTLKNEKGQEIGRAEQRRDGTTNFYDANGRAIGASKDRRR